jgi:hypothetical protein
VGIHFGLKQFKNLSASIIAPLDSNIVAGTTMEHQKKSSGRFAAFEA